MSDVLAFDDEASRRFEAGILTGDRVGQRLTVLGSSSPRPEERNLELGVGPRPIVRHGDENGRSKNLGLEVRPSGRLRREGWG